jgi:hypothetical protein
MSTIVNDLVSYLQCGEAIALNDAIRIDSADGKIYKFDCNNVAHIFAGMAKTAAAINVYIKVVQSGRMKGFSGLTPGALVYASTTTAGGLQLTVPASSKKVILGIAKSATELVINGGLGIKSGGGGIPDAVSFTLANNQAAAADITGLIFNPATVLGFVLEYTVARSTSLSKVVSIERFRGVWNSVSSTWSTSEDLAGDSSAVTLSITAGGQIQYTTSNMSGTSYAGSIKYVTLLMFEA